ncbi:transmembrane amino acid transporter protein-domain-containing protein [Irpex rosettiformis]|uniref:Transmembrane amino acid transporter protein-domain-containing protein n=1 Tax=Irpex rosettiformis TaxID=378272 RepID=A0ACB8U9Y5_9APHY|nr:transmembrane amino acid transporter protein-domain-containing protein [Irpex rosettiformis]
MSASSTPSSSSSSSRAIDIANTRTAGDNTNESLSTIGISGSPSARLLRAQFTGTPPLPNIPIRSSGTPIGTPRGLGTPANLPSGESPSCRPSISTQRPDKPNSSDNLWDELPDEDKAKILRKHLVSRDERQQGSPRGSMSAGSDIDVGGPGLRRPSSSQLRLQREDTEPFPVPYHAPGADVTHNIYKWQADKRRQAVRPRAASFAGSTRSSVHPTFEHIHEPGGFRRNYVAMQAAQRGQEEPQMLRNFIEFLYLFGHFAGEDLEEIEEEDDEGLDDDLDIERTPFVPNSLLEGAEAGVPSNFVTQTPPDSDLHDSQKVTERSPLLRRSTSRRRKASVGPHGDATVTQAVLMLLKSFVGTGILFLGKAFFNGGILFSSAILTFIALISLYSFLLLVRTKFVVSGSFGDIGGALYGPWMRYAILTSIVVSQIGFVSAYIIFVSENLSAFVTAITNCVTTLGMQYFIILQMVIFLPLALVRNLAKLSTTALVADVFILAGLIYIFGSEAAILSRRGHAHVELFNPKDWPLLIGTAVFSFEGIGLIIPITDAMKEPRRFPAVLSGVMLFLMVLFCGAGVMSYLTFGADVQTVVIVNLDTSSKFTQAVQFLYSMAIMLSAPLQLFPAVRIMETGLFERSGKSDPRVKWQKNIFRFATVVFCATLSYVGAADLDKFVSFIGSFACVPLCYVYPAMLHYKACARTRKQKIADISLMIFGMLAAAYTTVQTVRLMLEPAPVGGPTFGQCDGV